MENSLMDDFVIKSLWLNGSPNTKNILKIVFGKLAHVNTDNFVPYVQELGGINKSDPKRRVDILYISKDNTKFLNIEINRYNYSSIVNRNNSYVFAIEGSIYGKDENLSSKERYKVKRQTIQVNLNGYVDKENKNKRPSIIMLTNQETLDTEEDVIIYRYYLPNYKVSCYTDISQEPIEIKFLAMLSATTYEELELITKEESELKSIMDDFKRFDGSLAIRSDWEVEALEESIRSEIHDRGVAEGIAEGKIEGHAEGIAENKIANAKKMLEKNLDINLISDITGLTIEEIENLNN